MAKSAPSTQVQKHLRRKKEAFITVTSSLASSELELDMVGGGGGGGGGGAASREKKGGKRSATK